MSRTRYAQVLKFWISLSRYKRKKREKKKELYVSVCFYECLYNQTNKQAKKKKEEEDANIHKLVEVLTECVSSFPLCVNHLREQFKLGVCL